MKIVVTGALGHIGSKLIRELPRKFKGCEIVMIDNFLTQRYCSLFSLPKEGKYKFIEADVTKIDLLPIFSGADAVIHLAQIADLGHVYIGQKGIEKINYQSCVKVAQACAKAGVGMFFPSTTSVYGTNKNWIYDDAVDADLRPQSPYAENKLKSERFLGEFSKKSGLRYVIFRWGTIFGVSPGMRFNTAVNKFCLQAVLAQPLSVWRTAYYQFRPYLDLDDAIKSIFFLIKQDMFDGQIYNVLTVNSRVRDVIKIIRKYEPKVKIKLVDHPVMSKYSYKISASKIEKKGLKLNGDLERGIKETMNLLKSAANLPN